jgi:uncharacterized membrane protein YtjA (UPF0391 family)
LPISRSFRATCRGIPLSYLQSYGSGIPQLSLGITVNAREVATNGESDREGGIIMLRWAIIFLVIALIAALFGFTGIASAAAGIAKFLFFLFLVVCLVLFIAGMSVAKRF